MVQASRKELTVALEQKQQATGQISWHLLLHLLTTTCQPCEKITNKLVAEFWLQFQRDSHEVQPTCGITFFFSSHIAEVTSSSAYFLTSNICSFIFIDRIRSWHCKKYLIYISGELTEINERNVCKMFVIIVSIQTTAWAGTTSEGHWNCLLSPSFSFLQEKIFITYAVHVIAMKLFDDMKDNINRRVPS